MWAVIVLVLLAAALVFVLYGKEKNKKRPPESYVCDICGEKVCICRKEDTDN